MTEILRNIAAENSELLEDSEEVSSSQHLSLPWLIHNDQKQALGTEPAPMTEMLKYKDKQQAKKEK